MFNNRSVNGVAKMRALSKRLNEKVKPTSEVAKNQYQMNSLKKIKFLVIIAHRESGIYSSGITWRLRIIHVKPVSTY